MQVICLEDQAFRALIDEVVSKIKEQNNLNYDKWVSGDEAMKLLRITSKTTLQKLRDEGRIRYSQPEKKLILYDSELIFEFLNKSAKNKF